MKAIVQNRYSAPQGLRAKAQSCEVRDERLDPPDPELTHIRPHRTIYYSLGDPRTGAYDAASLRYDMLEGR